MDGLAPELPSREANGDPVAKPERAVRKNGYVRVKLWRQRHLLVHRQRHAAYMRKKRAEFRAALSQSAGSLVNNAMAAPAAQSPITTPPNVPRLASAPSRSQPAPAPAPRGLPFGGRFYGFYSHYAR